MTDEELAALGRELGHALFVWYNVRGQYPKGPACDQALYEVVGRTFMPFYMEHAVPEVAERPWCEIPAGWSVRTPAGEWLEIAATREDGDVQVVTFKPSGQSRRPRHVKVTCRPGTQASETDKALAALGRVEIIEDQVS